MAALNPKYYSGGRVGNWNFEVAIFGIARSDDDVILSLPIDKVSGLNSGKTNVVRHRNQGYDSTHLKPYPMLTTAETVTIEGTNLFDFSDVEKLKQWHDQVTGRINTGLGEYAREIVIINNKVDEKGSRVSEFLNGAGKIHLSDCIITKLTISDYDVNSPSHLLYTAEIEFSEMTKLGV